MKILSPQKLNTDTFSQNQKPPLFHNAGWSSPEARLAHTQEVAGSNPAPAISKE